MLRKFVLRLLLQMYRDVAVIIPHYNDHERLARCLAALLPQMGASDVVVVDNGSPIAPDVPQGVRLVIERRQGAANARNRGVAETTAERLLFLDCDCIPTADWLATAAAAVERADIVGGTVTLFDEGAPPRSGAEAFETVFAFDNQRYITRQGFSVTANLLTTRRVFEAVGGFRAGLPEDRDWCQRARAAGFELIHDDRLRVAHPTRCDWPALARKWRRLSDEAWGLVQEQPLARMKWAARALLMPLSALLHIPRILRHAGLNGPGERLAAIATLWRLRAARMRWMLRQAMGPVRRDQGR